MAFSQLAYEDHTSWVNWYNLDNATKPPLGTDFNDRIHSSKYAAGLEYKQIVSDNTFTILRGGYFRTWYNNTVPPSSINYLESTASSLNGEIQVNTSLNEKMLLTLGVNGVRNDVSSRQIVGDKLQYIFSSYGQVEVSNLDDIIVTAGGRLDIEKTLGENKNVEFSPKLGMSYKAPTTTQIRMSIGRAFRASSVTERFSALRYGGFTVSENPRLLPEKGWSFEIGANQNIEISTMPWNIDVAIFQSELYELIEPQFVVKGSTSTIQFVNITRARIQGAEISLKGWIGNKFIGIETSLTALSPQDLTTNSTLAFRHNLMWMSRAIFPLKAFEVQVDYRYLSRQEVVDERLANLGLVVNGDIRVPVHVIDTRLLFDFMKVNSIPLTLTLNIKNLFDYYYVEVPGNLAPTRQISMQIDARL